MSRGRGKRSKKRARSEARERYSDGRARRGEPTTQAHIDGFNIGFNMGWKALAKRRPGRAGAPRTRIKRLAEIEEE